MNHFDFMNSMGQAINSVSSLVQGLRVDIELLKTEITTMKNTVSQIQPTGSETPTKSETDRENERVVINTNISQTKEMIEKIEEKLNKVETLYQTVIVDSELDYFKSSTRENTEKLKNLEIALTIKTNTLDRSIKNIPKGINKDDVQQMIDSSIEILIGGLHSETQQIMQNNPIFVSLDTIQEAEEPIEPLDNDVHEDVVNETQVNDTDIQTNDDIDTTVVTEPTVQKPKRKYNKKSK